MTAPAPRARPRIGIPTLLEERRGRPYQALSCAYAEALWALGALPLYLPLQADPAALLEHVDGLLVPGGNDFLPAAPYPAGVHFDPVPEPQLGFDRALALGARARGLPVLGICYGMQLLALAHGGSLHHDIPTDLPRALPHRGEPGAAAPGHPVAVSADSRLARWLGTEVASVNTHHHQAVADPGPGFRAVAHAPDGVIEAIEATSGSPCVGVQWHPERSATAPDRSLLQQFIAACR